MDFDYLIIGGGIIGLAMAKTIREREPQASIAIVEKEKTVAEHASGRNSGVLHAGFYYTADSLKARFTVLGNQAMRKFCLERGLAINTCGKLVVATNEKELEQLYELQRRGEKNGSQVELISEEQARAIEPNVRTYQKALYSPLTATVDPKQVCNALFQELQSAGIQFFFSERFQSTGKNEFHLKGEACIAKKIINCAGLYADRIAQSFGFGKDYTIVPFKGLYLKFDGPKESLGTNIYPVPNLKNPFLGVHFTKTVDGTIKIGPTAIPALWRENYRWFDNFRLDEMLSILFYEAKLFVTNSFNFRSLAWDEMRKYSRPYLVHLAQSLVQQIDPGGFKHFTRPGIRAQLLNKRNLLLVQDFIVEGDQKSVHILNAVSPGFTCSFPFCEYVFENYISKSTS